MCEKIPLSESEAHRVINYSRRRVKDKRGHHRKPNKTIPKRAYWCEYCQAYHVTKQPKDF